MRLLLGLSVAALLLAACRDWDGAYQNAIEPEDAGVVDAGTADAGDDGGVDAGPRDAGPCDGSWCVVDSYISGSESTEGAWASGPDDAWLTSYAGLLHWDGTAWTAMRVSHEPARSVWGLGGTLLVGGENGSCWRGPPFSATQELTTDGFPVLVAIQGLADGGSIFATDEDWGIYRLEGDHWRALDAGPPPDTSSAIRGLAVVSETDVWAAGSYGTILHSIDGEAWERLDAGAQLHLRRAFAFSPTDVWFVGQDAVVVRWNGAAFTVSYCTSCGDIRAIWGRRSSDVYVLDGVGALSHWDGTRWARVTTVPQGINAGTGALTGAGDFDLFMSAFFADGGSGALHLRR